MVYNGDGNRVSETVGGATTVNGAVTRTYAYGLQRISENQLNGATWTPSFYGYDGHAHCLTLTCLLPSAFCQLPLLYYLDPLECEEELCPPPPPPDDA